MWFIKIYQRNGTTFPNVRITDSTQSQIKWHAAEKNPRSHGAAERKITFGFLKQGESLCFYLFNVVAPVSHWVINETQEGSSETKEHQPKGFDLLTFILRAPTKILYRLIHVCMLLMGLRGPC